MNAGYIRKQGRDPGIEINGLGCFSGLVTGDGLCVQGLCVMLLFGVHVVFNR